MDALNFDVLSTACTWLSSDSGPVYLAHVARTYGSAPRPVGSVMVLSLKHGVLGAVSGGCVEEHLLERLRREGHDHQPAVQVLAYGGDQASSQQFRLPCLGAITLVVEKITQAQPLQQLLQHQSQQQRVQRSLDLSSGHSALTVVTQPVPPSLSASHFVTSYGPTELLLLIGAGELSAYVARFALLLGYQVVVCEPRDDYRRNWPVAEVRVLDNLPDAAFDQLKPDHHLAVLALSHDPRLDDLALMSALPSAAFYVGALGSRRNQAKRRERLRQVGLSEADLKRLHGPIGLPIGALTSAEIALAVLAEITACRRATSYPHSWPE